MNQICKLNVYILILTTFSPTFVANILKYEEIDHLEVAAENFTIVNQAKNLELLIQWESWSCCSACCCSQLVCQQFANSEHCDSVKSYRYRYGRFALKKLNSMQSLEDTKLESVLNLTSTIFIDDYKEKFKLKFADSLIDELKSKLKLGKRTQKIFQIENCKNHVQKLNCWELEKCMFKSQKVLPDIELDSTKIDEDPCENATIFVLRDQHNVISLDAENLIRLQIAREIGDGNINSINYTWQNQRIEKLKEVNNCHSKKNRYFVHPNGEDALFSFTKKELEENQQILIEISYQNPEYMKIIVEIVPKGIKEIKVPTFLMKYFPFVFISGLMILVSVITTFIIISLLQHK